MTLPRLNPRADTGNKRPYSERPAVRSGTQHAKDLDLGGRCAF